MHFDSELLMEECEVQKMHVFIILSFWNCLILVSAW